MTAIEQAYAINAATPILTIELSHSALTDGVLRLVQSNTDLVAGIEDSSTVTFSKSGLSITRPSRDTTGTQSITLDIDNVSNLVWTEINKVVTANRSSKEKIICKLRTYLAADLTAPADAGYVLQVSNTSINRTTARIIATYAALYDTSFPKDRYYPTVYKGLKYV